MCSGAAGMFHVKPETQLAPRPEGRWSDLRTLLRFGNFRRLLLVRLLSQLADGVFQVALATYVVFSPEEQTSAAAIASAMAVLLLPYSLLGPFSGVLLDRWRRRQVLWYGNLVRAALAGGTAVLVVLSPPVWLFYLCALSVTAVNRFILAGLSAALPRVVDSERLVLANSLSPTAGTIAATSGGGVAFVVQFLAPDSVDGPALVVTMGALIYLLSGVAALRMGRDLLGPDPSVVQPHLLGAVASTARGLVAGLRHLTARRPAAVALGAMAVMRFCYGALTVMVLMLSRYAWSDGQSGSSEGIALLGVAVGVSGLGFFVAALITPSVVDRLGPHGWFALCAASATVLVPTLGLTFHPVPVLILAFVLGVVTQGSKICTDTVVQSSVDDAFRGRSFSLYDMLFNVAFVAAAGVAALILPADGRSGMLLGAVTVLYGATALLMARDRQRVIRRSPTADMPPR